MLLHKRATLALENNGASASYMEKVLFPLRHLAQVYASLEEIMTH
jgi:hypothetical protein